MASEQPTIAGMPNSRAIIAAWEVRPPLRVIISDACFINGSQSGVVISVTSTSPCSNTDSSEDTSSIDIPLSNRLRNSRLPSKTSP